MSYDMNVWFAKSWVMKGFRFAKSWVVKFHFSKNHIFRNFISKLIVYDGNQPDQIMDELLVSILIQFRLYL